MWTIVLFKDDNLVDFVPSHWVKKNNTCAWPKKNIKKHKLQRTMPNPLDFDFFSSRTLKKNIGK